MISPSDPADPAELSESSKPSEPPAPSAPQARHQLPLSVDNHDRDRAGMTYVYPVVSRRAGGVSVGINLNPNNACNWRCMYCQVPNLQRGSAPAIDLSALSEELRTLLQAIVQGDYLEKNAPPEARKLKDLAISGNGEPTTATTFDLVVAKVVEVMRDFDLVHKIPLVLISNGSMIGKAYVQAGLKHLGQAGGELWYKLDRIDPQGRRLVNDSAQSMEQVQRNLGIAAKLCDLRLQCCLFGLDGEAPSLAQMDAYAEFVSKLRRDGVQIRDIMVYGLARPSMQAEAPRLQRLAPETITALAARLQKGANLPVSVHP